MEENDTLNACLLSFLVGLGLVQLSVFFSPELCADWNSPVLEADSTAVVLASVSVLVSWVLVHVQSSSPTPATSEWTAAQ